MEQKDHLTDPESSGTCEPCAEVSGAGHAGEGQPDRHGRKDSEPSKHRCTNIHHSSGAHSL